MLTALRARLSSLGRSLTHSNEEQPLHRLALVVVVLLDVFILVSIFDGLDVHTRQLPTPEQQVPQRCRELVIDRSWTANGRLDRLAEAAATRHSPYGEPEKASTVLVPACQRALAPLEVVLARNELSPAFENRRKLADEVREAERALDRQKGAFDTQLLEALARPGSPRPDVKAIHAAVEQQTAVIETARGRLAEVSAQIEADPVVVRLWASLDAVKDADRAALVTELHRLEAWDPVVRLGMQLLFLLPLLAAFMGWHARSSRRGNGLQALVSAHLMVVASIPVLFRVIDAVYSVIPKRLLRRLMELLESLKLVALWHYLVMALAIGAALGLVLLIQRRLFSRERLLDRRISQGLCQACGRRLPAGAKACPGCGFVQDHACGTCGGATPVHARHCTACGATSVG